MQRTRNNASPMGGAFSYPQLNRCHMSINCTCCPNSYECIKPKPMSEYCYYYTCGYIGCNVQCSGCYYYQSGLDEPNYPVPATLLRAYEDDCIDMRCNYWEPSKP